LEIFSYCDSDSLEYLNISKLFHKYSPFRPPFLVRKNKRGILGSHTFDLCTPLVEMGCGNPRNNSPFYQNLQGLTDSASFFRKVGHVQRAFEDFSSYPSYLKRNRSSSRCTCRNGVSLSGYLYCRAN
jgi:hypothetical protein